ISVGERSVIGPPVCHCFGVNVTVTASPYFAQIRQNCLPESGKFARFFDHRVSVSFCASCCVSFCAFFCALFEVVCPPASRVIAGFFPLVCMIVFVIGFMIDLRTFLRSFFAHFFAHFFRDFSPHRRGF
ncbi:TPA: hypothetical protein ACHJ0T_005333, partial [Escherichia coli]